LILWKINHQVTSLCWQRKNDVVPIITSDSENQQKGCEGLGHQAAKTRKRKKRVIKDLKNQRSRTTDGNRKIDIFLLTHSEANTSIGKSCQIRKQDWSFSAWGGEQKHANKGNIQHPIDVHCSRTSVLIFLNDSYHSLLGFSSFEAQTHAPYLAFGPNDFHHT